MRGGTAEGFLGPLAIGAISKSRGVAVLGDADGAVLPVIGDASGGKRARAVQVIAGGIAIRIINDGAATNAGGGVWVIGAGSTLRGVDHVGTSRTERRVIDHVVGRVISISAAFGWGVKIIGPIQAVLAIIVIIPIAAGIRRPD